MNRTVFFKNQKERAISNLENSKGFTDYEF
jgi:hypothetical protein